MATKLNPKGLAYAQRLIKEDEVEHDKNNWEAVKATEDETLKFMQTHSMEEYGQWFLGINDKFPANARQHYEYPYGDFKVLHRSGLEAVAKRAAAEGARDIEEAAKKLLGMLK